MDLISPKALFIGLVLAVAPFVVIRTVSFFLLRENRRRGVKVPDYGIWMVEGEIGAGKTFFGVLRLLEFIIFDKRPVYTNLPLRWRVVKWYLRIRGFRLFGSVDGPKLAGLIRPLTEEHFRAFLDRQYLRACFYRDMRAAAMLRGVRCTDAEMSAAFQEKHGPDRMQTGMVDGVVRHGNWIPAMSVIMIDEVHEWFPMSNQRQESRRLYDYMSMARHHCHFVWGFTQERMRVNNTFRQLCTSLWLVRNISEERVWKAVKFKHLGIYLFQYIRVRPDLEKRTELSRAEYQETRYCFFLFPQHRWVFRLYASFTHLESVRSMRRGVDRARREAGLVTVDGRVMFEPDEKGLREEREVMVRKLKWVAILLFALVLGFSFGRSAMLGDALSRSVQAPAQAATAGVVSPGEWSPGEMELITNEGVRVNGHYVKAGGSVAGGRLVLFLGVGHLTVWSVGDGLYAWKFGSAPQYLGTRADVGASLRAMAAADVARGRGVGAVESAVESAAGVAVGDAGESGGSSEGDSAPVVEPDRDLGSGGP